MRFRLRMKEGKRRNGARRRASEDLLQRPSTLNDREKRLQTAARDGGRPLQSPAEPLSWLEARRPGSGRRPNSRRILSVKAATLFKQSTSICAREEEEAAAGTGEGGAE